MTKKDRPRSSTTKPFKRREGRAPFRSADRSELHKRRKDLVVFYGVQACLAIFKHRRHEISRVFMALELAEPFREVITWCNRQRIPCKIAEHHEVTKVASTEHHEGVCIEAKPVTLETLDSVLTSTERFGGRCVLVLEGVENPHNIGAILRTACFFGATAVVLVSRQRNPLSGAACRVAEGGAELVPVVVTDDGLLAVKTLRDRGFHIVATTPHRAESLYSAKWPKQLAILFGSEGSGLSKEILNEADDRVVIPRIGQIESLNVGAAVAAVLAEARREAVVRGALKTR